ncbi:GNAT family N-acetyltransferase [Psychromicrobium lacuslunae]|uniref:GNAT family N-acetyltransferase n=1 Tax=Psychromicrobium lacuslunae TaxID=1618207 RepID=UPI000697ED58|nr:GNAT family N-acetyltransferase [Psychromicrobium lacuslunae]
MQTERLLLSPLGLADLNETHRVYADPETWLHLPSGRHTELAQTEQMVRRAEQDWSEQGAGAWAVRLRHGVNDLAEGAFIGTGGINVTVGGAWNLGYRLTPASWGKGLATELALAAMAFAAELSAQTPVTGRVLENNPASFVVLEKAGLKLRWQYAETASDHGSQRSDDPHSTIALPRRIYADREIDADLLNQLIALG